MNYDTKQKQIIEYCRPHLSYMWAAHILSIILGCDFRDVKSELEVYDDED